MVWPFKKKKDDRSQSEPERHVIPVDPIQLRPPARLNADLRELSDGDDRADMHPVAKLIDDIGRKVGLRSASKQEAVGGHDVIAHDGLPDDHSDKAEMSVCSEIVNVADLTMAPGAPRVPQAPVVKHIVQIVGRKPMEQASNTAPSFARLIHSMIDGAGGDSERAAKGGALDNRQITVTHDDVTERERAQGKKSEVEQRLEELRDILYDPKKADYLEKLQQTMFVASAIEAAFSQEGKYASRIVPTYRKGDMGEPVFGMTIQTNHPALKEQFSDSSAKGISTKRLDGAFTATIAGTSQSYSDGVRIKAEGHQGLKSLVEGVMSLQGKLQSGAVKIEGGSHDIEASIAKLGFADQSLSSGSGSSERGR